MFGKTKKLMKNKEKLSSNPANDIFHAMTMERKQRDDQDEPESDDEEMDKDLKGIEDKKRERAKKALRKYKADY